MTGAQIVAEMLDRLGIRYISGVPGHTVLDLINAVYDKKDRIRPILPRNEEAASFMADAYFRVTHRPMAVFGHISVGSANLLTGVTNAYLDSSAMIVITGNAWSRNQGRGAYQELSRGDRDAATVDMFRGSVKRSWYVDRAERLPEILLRAYRTALSGRPGPVHIDITQDAFAEAVDVELPEVVPLEKTLGRPRADRANMERALALLREAKRPAILAGGGVLLSEASPELMRVAQLLGCPVGTTIHGKGSFPEDHDLAVGITGWVGTVPGNKAMRECDVLLAVGTRFSETDTSGWLPGKPFQIPPTKVIQIDIDPLEIGRYYPIEVGLVGDAKAVLEELAAGLQEDAGDKAAREPWMEEIRASKAEWAEIVRQQFELDSVPIGPGRVIHELRKALPKDGILVCDVGNAAKWASQLFTAYYPGTVLGTMGGAAMGFGAGGAIGAQLAAPDKRVACWIGDGSMAMTLHVLPTVMELGLPIVYVVLNDFAYGAIKRPQDFRYGKGRNIFSLFQTADGRPYDLDFAKVGEALGMGAEKVTDPARLAPALRKAFDANRPYILDVRVELETYVPLQGGGTFPLPQYGAHRTLGAG
ncbi:MAG TPA: thiamine pyrophosphate-binding protein [Limnochordales bacterium]